MTILSRRSFFSSLLLVLGATPPAPAPKVRTGHDTRFDFSAVHTYRWKVGKGPAPTEALDARIRATANEALARMGLQKVDPGEPADLDLVYAVGTEDTLVAGPTAEIGEIDWFGDLWLPGAERSRTSGGIRMELQDPESEKTVWGASWVQSGNHPDPLQILIQDADKAVETVLGKYPPKKRR